jgi:hypothetical protein
MNKIKASFLSKELKQVNSFDCNNVNHMRMLPAFGINENVYAMDSQESFIGGGVSANISNLRNFLPGIVKDLTTVRKIDTLVGQTMIGDWSDEEIVQMIQERTATAIGYSDDVNIPFTSYNIDYERRSIVRFVVGTQSQLLADSRITKSGGNPEEARMSSAVTALEIARNTVGFFGYNSGNNKTYGLLNDPNLPAYQTLPNGANATPEWSTKTFQEKQLDVVNAITALQLSSGGNFDPTMDSFTFSISLAVAGTLTNVNEFGISIQKWIKETYPMCRIEFVPEFDGANGGANVFYMYADNISGDSTDNGNTVEGLISEKFMSIGRGQVVGGYQEGFINAVAGVLVKRPWGVYRATGV